MQELNAFVNGVLNNLFAAENRRLVKNQDALVEMNDEALQVKNLGFTYNGKQIIHTSAVIKSRTYPSLVMSLTEQMGNHLKDVAQVNLDRQQIFQILFKLLYSPMTVQERFDAMPACLRKFHAGFDGMTHRSSQTGWLILLEPRLRNQYEEIHKKMLAYSVTSLLY